MSQHRFITARWSSAAVALGGMLLTAGSLAALAPGGALAASHREAPAIAGLPQYDTTDVYAFLSPTNANRVVLVANWIPFEEPAGGPNFYPFATDARYDINIDNDGDAKPDIVYRWTFRDARTPRPADSFTGNGTFLYNNGPVTSLTDANLLYRQTYDLKRIEDDDSDTILDDAPVAPSFVGAASMPNYRALRDQAIITHGSGASALKSFAGQADDSFFLDLRVFDLLYGGNLSEVGVDTLAGYNVNTVVLEVPKRELTDNGEPVIGVWSTTSKRNGSDDWVQVSRLGSPLVNELVIPYQKKNAFNASKPKNDLKDFGKFVLTPELPEIVEAVYGIPAPATPRNDLVQAFVTGFPGLNQPAELERPGEMLRLNTNRFAGQTFNRLGVIGGDLNGFPNGRRLADDVVDIALQVVEGRLLPGRPPVVGTLGDAVNRNDVDFSTAFPYVALPHSGSAPRGAAAANSNASAHLTPLTGGGPIPSAPQAVSATAVATGVGGLLLLGVGLVGIQRGLRRPRPVAA